MLDLLVSGCCRSLSVNADRRLTAWKRTDLRLVVRVTLALSTAGSARDETLRLTPAGNSGDRTAQRRHATFAGWCPSTARCYLLRSKLRSPSCELGPA